MALLNEYRIHTNRVERKVREARAFLHNSQALLRDLAEAAPGPDAITTTDINQLQTMIGHAVKALNKVSD